MLSPERWEIVERVFHEALERPPETRRAFVDSSCDDDPEIRSEVESLLAAESSAGSRTSVAASAAASWSGARSIVGRTIDAYRVVSLLGAGGMGEVYLADDVELGRRVALKLLPEAFAADPARLRRFADEARAASALNHPNIITVHRVGDLDGRRYIVTEFVHGETLRERLARGPLPLADAIDIATQIGSALTAAHEAGIIHRDIKPDNVMIRRDGYAKVLDFGLAKVTRPSDAAERPSATRIGAVLGTADYMAPEQAAGSAVDARADLYSLCVVLHEMLTGALPRELSDAPALSRDVRRLLVCGLATDPSSRFQTAPDLLRALDAVRPRPNAAAKGSRRLWIASAFALALLVIAAAGIPSAKDWFARSRGGPGAVASISTLAVLPFQTQQLGSGDQYLGLGIADAVITQLGGLAGVAVRPTTSVRAYQKPDVDVAAAGVALGVDSVLSGLVQRNGDAFRVTVQLMDVKTGAQRWADRIDMAARDLSSLQDTVARRVAAALVTRMTTADRSVLASRQPSNPQAYEMYLRGRYFLARTARPDVERSLALFEQAVALDPQYALAHAAIGTAHYTLGLTYTPGSDANTSMPLARQAALKALALDPGIAEAYSVLASVQFQYDHEMKAAEASYAQARALGPNNAVTFRGHGWYLAAFGRRDESVAELKHAVELDPTESIYYENLACVLQFAGRTDEALDAINTGIRMDPGNSRTQSRKVWMLESDGRDAEAIAARQSAWRAAGRDDEARRAAQLYATGGYRAIFEDEAARPRDPIAAAWAHVRLDDPEAALDELERAEREKHTWIVVINVDPRFASLHGHPRFDALLKRIGLT